MKHFLLSVSVLAVLVLRTRGACSIGDGLTVIACLGTLQQAAGTDTTKLCAAVETFKECVKSVKECENEIQEALDKAGSTCGGTGVKATTQTNIAGGTGGEKGVTGGEKGVTGGEKGVTGGEKGVTKDTSDAFSLHATAPTLIILLSSLLSIFH